MTKTIVILGATGKVGSKIAEILIKEGHNVKLISRSIDSSDQFENLANAEVIPGDMTEPKTLTEVFKNADSAFVMVPPHFTTNNYRDFQRQVGDSTIQAIRNSGITHIVNLSSAGAHMHEGNGIIAGLAEQEIKLNQLKGVNILHLRPGYFLDNALLNIKLIKDMGIYGTSADASHKIPMVATNDIALIASGHLSNLDFTGKTVRPILGARDYSFNELTSILGIAINKPDLQYVQFPIEQYEKAMTDIGISENVAEDIVNMETSLKNGVMNCQKRTNANTSPITAEIFAKEVFAPAYRAL